MLETKSKNDTITFELVVEECGVGRTDGYREEDLVFWVRDPGEALQHVSLVIHGRPLLLYVRFP
jgi:hypothetical protein